MTSKEYFLNGLLTPHSGDRQTLQKQIHWTLRITAALCFIGHGTWGLITKSGWLPFFASQGIEPELAWTLQPVICAFDILMALLLLKSPNRTILIWMFFGLVDGYSSALGRKSRKGSGGWRMGGSTCD